MVLPLFCPGEVPLYNKKCPDSLINILEIRKQTMLTSN